MRTIPMTVASISWYLQGRRLGRTGKNCATHSSPVTNYHLGQFFTP